MTARVHVPVLRAEVMRELAPAAGKVLLDATLGRGGHTEAWLEATGPSGRVLAFDRDPVAIAESTRRLAHYGGRFQAFHAPFGTALEVLDAEGIAPVDALLADLGVSSPQLDDPTRGFSFREDGPLDMRMDPTRGRSARDVIAELATDALADLIFHYGDEPRSRAIARSIKQAESEGQLATTADLVRAVHRVTGPKRGPGIDPATRTFQAIRIEVNDELGEVEKLLSSLPKLLAPRGVAAIIAFHSLEDRTVKHFVRESKLLVARTRRPIEAGSEEIAANPRSRSAKLRVIERVQEVA